MLIETIRQSRAVEQMLCSENGSKGAVELSRKTALMPGAVAWIAHGAARDVSDGVPAGKAFETRQTAVMGLLKRDFVVLVSLTAVAPLLGLLGTVMGMIETFDAVSATSGETGVRVASGISRALITTQFGLVVALPGVFGMARLRRLLRQVQVRVAECRAHLVPLLTHGTKDNSQ